MKRTTKLDADSTTARQLISLDAEFYREANYRLGEAQALAICIANAAEDSTVTRTTLQSALEGLSIFIDVLSNNLDRAESLAERAA